MAGITLSMDDIKAAPSEVRRWLEHEVARALGSQAVPAPAPAQSLVGCSIEETRDMLALVQGMLPVVSVFFELGREAASGGDDAQHPAAVARDRGAAGGRAADGGLNLISLQ